MPLAMNGEVLSETELDTASRFGGGVVRNLKRAVIVTALPLEYKAVRKHLTDIVSDTHPQGTIYEVGVFSVEKRPAWQVSIVQIGPQNSNAALEAERAIARFKPAVALFVGIGGGLKDVKKGDVVAATKIYGYESGKDSNEFLPRPDVGQVTYDLEQRSRAECVRPHWLKRLSSAHKRVAPEAFVAPIAAGEKVVASKRSATYRFLRKQYSDALAVEMEGRGFLVALNANRQVGGSVIRGISDLVGKKTQADAAGFQPIAAATASAFAFQLLAGLTKASSTTESKRITLVFDSDDRDEIKEAMERLMALVGTSTVTYEIERD